MKTRKKALIFGVISILVLLVVSTIAYAGQYLNIDLSKADDYVQSQIAKKNTELGMTSQQDNVGFYDECLQKAKTQEQKDAIAALKTKKDKTVGVWKRDALIIIGQLPKDQKRISIDEAKQIVKDNKTVTDITSAFDSIAGAPDFVGGSGIGRTIYYLDDKQTNAIYLIENRIIYVSTDTNGNQTSVPLDGTALPVPVPSMPASN